MAKKPSRVAAESPRPMLAVPRDDAKQKIQAQIDKGKDFLARAHSTPGIIAELWKEYFRWEAYNYELLKSMFNTIQYANEYRMGSYGGGGYRTAKEEIDGFNRDVDYHVNDLQSMWDRLDLIPEDPGLAHSITVSEKSQMKSSSRIFIGHGRSPAWLELQAFIRDRLSLDYEEFNRETPAGLSNKERLSAMLNSSCFAFLVLTAEDEQADGSTHARQNVVHEAGLFQGRYGFERAIILLEEGCEPFSNVDGIGYIGFPAGKIKATFEEVRQVLEREKILKSRSS